MTKKARKGQRVSGEETWLRTVFERILLVAIAAPAAVANACSTSSPATEVGGPDAGADASSDGNIADGDVSETAIACTPTSVYVDAALADGAVDCDIYNDFSCGLPAITPARADCFFSLNDCPALCPGAYFFNCRSYGNWCVDGSILPRDASVTLDDGAVTALDPEVVECATCPNGAGRRPSGLAPSRRRSTVDCSALGSYFASTAHLERASVIAFRSLRADLARLRAPKNLVREAVRAARDEIRHARETSRLARRFGASPPKVVVAKQEERTLEDLALENAAEGCVRETFGALVASWQAAHAADADIAKTMRVIASDETRHAAHAWSIAKWSGKRLDFAAKKRAVVALQQAIAELEEASVREPHRDLVRIAGVPDARTQRAMLAALRRTLWV